MTARAGFTLMELLVALTLTALLSTIALGVYTTSIDAHAAVAADDGARNDALVLGWVTDLLHHPPSAELVDAPLVQALDGGGVMFLSHGVHAPFGTGAIWRVRITADRGSALVEAVPIARLDAGDTSLRPIVARIGGIGAIDAAFLERIGDRAWRAQWPVAQSRPAALRLTFAAASGSRRTAAPAPLVVTLDVGGVP